MIKIVRASKKDLAAMTKIASPAFSGMKDPEKAKKWLGCNFAAFPRAQYFVAKQDKRVLGYILWLEKGGFRKEAVLELEQIAVARADREKGIGSQLILHSLSQIKTSLQRRDSRLKLVEISTGAENPAQRLYKKALGAEAEAVIKDLFRGDEAIMIARF